jgi:hypothetical protein
VARPPHGLARDLAVCQIARAKAPRAPPEDQSPKVPNGAAGGTLPTRRRTFGVPGGVVTKKQGSGSCAGFSAVDAMNASDGRQATSRPRGRRRVSSASRSASSMTAVVPGVGGVPVYATGVAQHHMPGAAVELVGAVERLPARRRPRSAEGGALPARLPQLGGENSEHLIGHAWSLLRAVARATCPGGGYGGG